MLRLTKKTIMTGCFGLILLSWPVVGQQPKNTGGNKSDREIRIPLKARAFDLGRVRLLDGPLREATKRNQKYLRDLELDRLLHNFRLTAGIPSSAKPLGGWESPSTELRGHFVGHFLSACAMMYVSFDDVLLKTKADTLVSELAKCQEKLGNGYLSAYPEEFITRVETGVRVWAPWYTLHKIYQGLIDVYLLTGNKQALDVVKKMADWAKKRVDQLSDEQMQKMLKVEFGGMSESLFNLYALTHDPKHLALAKRFEKREFLDPLRDYTDKLKGLHVNTHIPQVIGVARGYELTGEENYRSISTFFWDQVVHARSYATGGTSNGEHWGSEPYHLSTQLGSTTEESCCSYNMLKLTTHLFSWDPEPRYADYYERTFINSILPTQHPSTGMLMYYKPLGSGWYGTFGTPRNSFWCCTGTGVESFARLQSDIYFHDENSLYVNLFIPSELKWKERGLAIRQETEFPNKASTSFIINVSNPIALSLKVRVPEWSASGARVKINAKELELTSSPSSYLIINRTWNNGDRIDIEYEMKLHLHRMPDNPNMAAIMYGPLVLAGKLGKEGLADSLKYGPYGPTLPPVLSPVLVANNIELELWIEAAPGKPLTFRIKGVGDPRDIELGPLNELVDERYAVYWTFFDKDGWDRAKRESAQLVSKVVDKVIVGDAGSEREHNLVGNEMKSGSDAGMKWVSTKDWISVTMNVLIDRPVILKYSYFKSDTGRSYSLMLDEIRLQSKPMVKELSNGIIEEEYEIPLTMTHGRHTVVVSFQSRRWFDGKKMLGCEMYGSTKSN